MQKFHYSLFFLFLLFISIESTNQKVFYVDYGTVSEAYKKDTRFLDIRFAAEPAFALRGCMDRVRPNDGIWTLKAMDDFLERLKDYFTVPILAKVTLLNLPVSTAEDGSCIMYDFK